jgi:nucleotide-binding universal stress UspA family protein
MEKILLVINAHKPDVQVIRFASDIAKDAGSKLTGVFVENVYFEYIPSSDEPVYEVSASTISESTLIKGGIITDIDLCIRIFKEQCEKNGVSYELYQDKGEPIQEIIFESRFSDLLIIDPALSFQNKEEDLPSHFTREVLLHAECPVLLTPGRFEEIKEVVFCYDGSASAVFAIKQFTYLFSFYNNKKVTLLEVDHKKAVEYNDSKKKLIDLLRCHFSSVHSKDLKGNPEEELFKYFFNKTGMMIVMGAYGRSMLSNLFKKSAAELLIRMVDLPLFITHI